MYVYPPPCYFLLQSLCVGQGGGQILNPDLKAEPRSDWIRVVDVKIFYFRGDIRFLVMKGLSMA